MGRPGFDMAALDAPWAMGKDGFEGAFEEISGVTPLRRLLEFGSGISTRAFAALLPDVEIVAVDHDARYCAHFEPGEGANATVAVAPLVERRVLGLDCRTYDWTPSGRFDAALVDGPPGDTPDGRLGSLLLAWQAVRPGGRVVLDDAFRPDELRALADLLQVVGGTWRFVNRGHGLAVVERGPDVELAPDDRHAALHAVGHALKVSQPAIAPQALAFVRRASEARHLARKVRKALTRA